MEDESTNSTHKVEVVRISRLEKHPNADSLSIAHIDALPGYPVIVRTDDWAVGQLGAYVPPDSLVPITLPQFDFLDPKKPDQTHVRVRAKKIRGLYSQGLLAHVDIPCVEGEDLAPLWDVRHWNPPEQLHTNGNNIKAPARIADFSMYDVEAFRKYGKRVFMEGEPVWITEKLHGSNARFFWDGEKLCVGSRKYWKAEDDTCIWWRAANKYPGLGAWCAMNPDMIVFGEVIGKQDMKYGLTNGDVDLYIFDMFNLTQNRWLNSEEARRIFALADISLPKFVPIVEMDYPFNFEEILEMAEGESLVAGADHIREGVVVRPAIDRWDPQCGRVHLKVVGNGYLCR